MSGTTVDTVAGPALSAGQRAGAVVGYVRSAGGADDAGSRALRAAGCERVYADGTPGGESGRPRLRACLESLRPADTLVVASLDQLGRSQRELIATVEEVRLRGAGLRSLREELDTTAPGGAAIFRVFAGLADFGRATIAAGTSDGMATARARGKRLGRPPALTPEQLREVRALLLRPGHTVSSVAAAMGVSRSTIYKYLPDASPSDADIRPAGAHVAPYQARPGRRVLVIDDLADLRGPTTGTVELPLRLFWHPNRAFDLEEPGILRWLYQIVLREAGRPDDLTSHLDGAALVRLWPDLRLPQGVRRAWEASHPSLRATAEV